MTFSKLCINCFQKIDVGTSKGTVCPYCGFDEKKYTVKPHHLPPRTPLNGRYVIGRVLGEGGFGITYKAWDVQLQTCVAIKELFIKKISTRINTTVEVDPENRGAFDANKELLLQEARLDAMLSEKAGAGIVSVKEYFQENGTSYMVMEYLEGETLKSYVKRKGHLTYNETIDVLSHVADALSYVHKQGIVHRDISPDNIMMLRDGRVKLMDFGGAQILDEAKSESVSSYKRGYAPPEQYSVNGNIGTWTDVYSFAATVYYCLTGEKPTDAMTRAAGAPVESVIKKGGSISTAQDKCIQKALELEPKDRYQSIREFLDDFSKVASKKASSTVDTRKESGKSKKTFKIAGPIIAAIVVIAAVLLIVKNLNPDKPETPATEQETETEKIQKEEMTEELTADTEEMSTETMVVETEEKSVETEPITLSTMDITEKSDSPDFTERVTEAVATKVTETNTEEVTENVTEGMADQDEQTSENVPFAPELINIGDTFTLGNYSGAPIEWIVINRSGGEVLVTSRYCIEQKAFNESSNSNIWVDSTIRSWLNNDFYSSFSDDEKAAIAVHPVSYQTGEGEDQVDASEDAIFLLSEGEVTDYFSSSDTRRAEITGGTGSQSDSDGEVCSWILRTKSSDGSIEYVTDDGEINAEGLSVSDVETSGIRPAMWVNISLLSNLTTVSHLDLTPGSRYIFGLYEQDNNQENGMESIPWIILDKNSDQFLITTQYCIDSMPFCNEEESGNGKWEDSLVRSWLNNDFYEAVFSDAEKSCVLETESTQTTNSNNNEMIQSALADKLFLLSEEEVNRYMPEDVDKQVSSTTFAENEKGCARFENGNCFWLLRTPGSTDGTVEEVSDGGVVNVDGCKIFDGQHGIRPAMWVKLP